MVFQEVPLSTRAKNLFLILVLTFSLNGGLVLEYVVPYSLFLFASCKWFVV